MATHSSTLAWNPRDGGAWLASIYGIAQSWTWLKRLSSSSSSRVYKECLQINKEKTTQSKMSKGYEMAICRKGIWGLPWWLSGKESACQCRRHRFNPWSRKISHVTEQLSPLRAVLQSPGTSSREAAAWEVCALQLETSPHSNPTGGNQAVIAAKTQHCQN